jgi:hypothetical protein
MHRGEQNARSSLIAQTKQRWTLEADGVDNGLEVFNLLFQRNRTGDRIREPHPAAIKDHHPRELPQALKKLLRFPPLAHDL